jgi:glycosyltransferase involved in cell wall biosynthesis
LSQPVVCFSRSRLIACQVKANARHARINVAMRINFVLSSLFLSGGVQVVIEYANRLAARGHQVAVVIPRGTAAPEMAQRVARAVTLHESKASLNMRRHVLGHVRLAWSLQQALPPSDMIIATHTPTIVPVCLATLGHRTRRAWLYMDYTEMFQGRSIENWLLRHGPRWFDRLMTLSESGRAVAQQDGAAQATVVGLGLTDEDLFRPLVRMAKAHPVAMYLGDARPRKGLAEFLAAAEMAQQKIPDLHLLIVTKDQPTIKTSLSYEHIINPDRPELPDLYRRASVFVSSSWGEGFGLPPLEAMACGTPVVLTDSRGVRDYVQPDTNCVMVQPGNIEKLAAAIIRVLSDRSFAQKIGQAGVVTAARFQWDECVDRLEVVLRA